MLALTTVMVRAQSFQLPVTVLIYLFTILASPIALMGSDDFLQKLPSRAQMVQYAALGAAVLCVVVLPARTLLFILSFSLPFSLVFFVPAIGGWRKWVNESRHEKLRSFEKRWLAEGVYMHPSNKVREGEQALDEWINTLNAHTLHELAIRWNWDAGHEILVSVLKHPDCDRATAMSLYALADPAYFETVSKKADDNDEGCQVLNEIAKGFEDGRFRKGRLALDTDFTLEELKEYRDERRTNGDLLFWDLPDRAFAPLSGRKHNPQYELIHGDTLMYPFVKWARSQNAV